MVDEIVSELTSEQSARVVKWTIDRLPHIDADPAMLRVVWRNLLENALKYTKSRDVAEVQVGTSPRAGQTSFFVRDNGVGFDVRFAAKLVGVFQRLHPVEEFAGTRDRPRDRTPHHRAPRRTYRWRGKDRRRCDVLVSLPDDSRGAACPSPA